MPQGGKIRVGGGCVHIKHIKVLGQLHHILPGFAVQQVLGRVICKQKSQRQRCPFGKLTRQLRQRRRFGWSVTQIDELSFSHGWELKISQNHLTKALRLAGRQLGQQTGGRVLAGGVEPGGIIPIQPGGAALHPQGRGAVKGPGPQIVPQRRQNGHGGLRRGAVGVGKERCKGLRLL